MAVENRGRTWGLFVLITSSGPYSFRHIELMSWQDISGGYGAGAAFYNASSKKLLVR